MDSLEREFQNLGVEDEAEDNQNQNQNQNRLDENRNPIFQIYDGDDENEEQEDQEEGDEETDESGEDGGDEEEEESEEEEHGEPTHVCLICSSVIPVSSSLVHKRDCYYHDDNHTCPFCFRRRREQLMEEHIKYCSQRYNMSKDKVAKTIYLWRCSPDVVELSLRKIREDLEERYKKALHMKWENPLNGCIVCNNDRQHAEGLCLHTLIGSDFKWRAERVAEKDVYPQYTNFLEIVKKRVLLSAQRKFEKRWKVSSPEERESMETLEAILERTTHEADQTMERLMNEKKAEINEIIKRQTRAVGNRTTWYRDYYIYNILYPSMGIQHNWAD